MKPLAIAAAMAVLITGCGANTDAPGVWGTLLVPADGNQAVNGLSCSPPGVLRVIILRADGEAHAVAMDRGRIVHASAAGGAQCEMVFWHQMPETQTPVTVEYDGMSTQVSWARLHSKEGVTLTVIAGSLVGG